MTPDGRAERDRAAAEAMQVRSGLRIGDGFWVECSICAALVEATRYEGHLAHHAALRACVDLVGRQVATASCDDRLSAAKLAELLALVVVEVAGALEGIA